MQIILLHPRMTQARSITLAPRHLAMFLAAFTLAVLLVTGMQSAAMACPAMAASFAPIGMALTASA